MTTTNFSYEIRDRAPDGVELVLKGYMDEETHLPDISTFKNTKKLMVNFRMVKSVLSMGIKIWINFADQLESLEPLQVVLTDCSKQVVDQINLVEGFLPKNATVKTIFIPVFCNKCERQFNVFRKTESLSADLDEIIPSMEGVDCQEFPSCKENYEVEVNPVSYLKFLKG